MSDHLKEVASKIVTGENVVTKPKLEKDATQIVSVEECEDEQEKKSALSYAQMVKNVIKTHGEIR